MTLRDFVLRLLSVFSTPTSPGNVEPTPPIPAPPEGSVPSDVIRLVNAVRAKHGKASLAEDPRLNTTAQAWSVAMSGSGVLSHAGMTSRLAAFPDSGECVAEGQQDATEVVTAWENHPPHFLIMIGDYTIAGAGMARGFWCLDVAKV